jgi:hypothetical protein
MLATTLGPTVSALVIPSNTSSFGQAIMAILSDLQMVKMKDCRPEKYVDLSKACRNRISGKVSSFAFPFPSASRESRPVSVLGVFCESATTCLRGSISLSGAGGRDGVVYWKKYVSLLR